ncbi:MAG: hypothetical protein V2A61_05910, partial [Calditrichota bacterium]
FTMRESPTQRVDGLRPLEENPWVRDLPQMQIERSDFPLIRLRNAVYAIGGRTTMRREEHGVTASVEFYAWHEEGWAPEPGPASHDLIAAWPNPGNGWITFQLPREGQRVILFNHRGEQIMSSDLISGAPYWTWFAGDQPAGVYFYQIQSERGIIPGGPVVILK